MRLIILIAVLFAHLDTAMAQPREALLEAVKNHPAISWGGCDVISLEGVDYLVSVASLEVGTKKLPQLNTVGSTKARRELLKMISGSEISSTTQMTTSEESVDIDGERSTSTVETYFELIRENANGWVQGMSPLGGWYSDDHTIFFYAIFRSIN